MGTYYMWICPSRKERIDPDAFADEINPKGSKGRGIKGGPVTLGHLSNAVTCFLLSGGWKEELAKIVADYGEEYEEADQTFSDVTHAAIRHFIEQWPYWAEKWQIRYLPENT